MKFKKRNFSFLIIRYSDIQGISSYQTHLAVVVDAMSAYTERYEDSPCIVVPT